MPHYINFVKPLKLPTNFERMPKRIVKLEIMPKPPAKPKLTKEERREKQRQYGLRYYREHKEQCLERTKEWQSEHKGYSRQYYLAHKEELLERNREQYRLLHPKAIRLAPIVKRSVKLSDAERKERNRLYGAKYYAEHPEKWAEYRKTCEAKRKRIVA